MFGHINFFYAEIDETFVFCREEASETPTIASDEDVLSLLMEQHELFLSSTRSRLTKLQVSAVLDQLALFVV